MRAWVDLYQQHNRLRSHGGEAVTQIRNVLKSLGEQRPSVFRDQVQARLQPQKNTKNNFRTFQLREAVVLQKLSDHDRGEVHLQEAHLHVLLMLDTGMSHLHGLTVMIDGKRRDSSLWTVAVHLTDDSDTEKNPSGDRQGKGACGHAVLHCHVGSTLDMHPKVRVPLPPLTPGEVVEWVMSQVVPTVAFEPAPWAKVVEELNRKKK